MKQRIAMLDAYGRRRGVLPPALLSSIENATAPATTPAYSLPMSAVSPGVQATPPETPIPGVAPVAITPGGQQLNSNSGTPQTVHFAPPSVLPLLVLGGLAAFFFFGDRK